MNENIIDFFALWELFRKKFLLIFVFVVLGLINLSLLIQMFHVPQYEATATLYLSRQGEEEIDTGEAYEDYSLALRVINDCAYLLDSHTVLDPVIEMLNLPMDYDELADRIRITHPTDTRILQVTVQADTPVMAKEAADQICLMGQELISPIVESHYLELVEYSTMPIDPCNKPGMVLYLLAAVLLASIVYTILLIQQYYWKKPLREHFFRD